MTLLLGRVRIDQMKLHDIITAFEKKIPLSLQEDWDHSGLNLGSLNANVTGVFFSYDVCLESIAAAKKKKCQLIVSHHPFRMRADVKLDLDSYEGRLISECVKNGISLYSAHTNHDASEHSLNFYYLKKLGLTKIRPLKPVIEELYKLAVFVPRQNTAQVMNALFEAGAGGIGPYSECSFRVIGIGTFKGDETTRPAIGKKNVRESVDEERLEMIVPAAKLPGVIKALLAIHPYEEVAYDLYKQTKTRNDLGLGAYGDFVKPAAQNDVIKKLKSLFRTDRIRFVTNGQKTFRRIGICTGSGASLMAKAKSAGCDLFVTGDVKYHQAIEAKRDDLAVADVGHFYSEIDSVRILMSLFLDLFGKKLGLHIYTGLKDAFLLK